MKPLKRIIGLVAVVALGALLGLSSSIAQVPPQVSVPYNVDVGVIITNTARGASTFNSPSQTNLAYRGVVCTFNQSAHGGSPSTTFSIQGFDTASASWFTLVTSGAITADATPTPIAAYPGAQTASLPTGMVAIGHHLPRTWRLTETIGGTATPTVTGTVGCNYLN